jgi:hypothetical protein
MIATTPFHCICPLAECYASLLKQLPAELVTLVSRVDKHLKKMGTVWK